MPKSCDSVVWDAAQDLILGANSRDFTFRTIAQGTFRAEMDKSSPEIVFLSF